MLTMLPAPLGVPFRGRRHPIVSGRASACHQRQRPCRLSPCEGGGLPHLCGQPPRAARFEERAGVGASVGCGSFWPTLKLANTAGSFRAGTGGGPDPRSHWLASFACPLVTLRTATGTGMWLALGVSVTSSIMTLEDEKRGKPTMETPRGRPSPHAANASALRVCAPAGVTCRIPQCVTDTSPTPPSSSRRRGRPRPKGWAQPTSPSPIAKQQAALGMPREQRIPAFPPKRAPRSAVGAPPVRAGLLCNNSAEMREHLL